MANKMFDAFSRAFDEQRKSGLSNWEAFEKAKNDFTNSFNFSPYKDAESFIATRSYHRKKSRRNHR